jgi:hypothetical protein
MGHCKINKKYGINVFILESELYQYGKFTIILGSHSAVILREIDYKTL